MSPLRSTLFRYLARRNTEMNLPLFSRRISLGSAGTSLKGTQTVGSNFALRGAGLHFFAGGAAHEIEFGSVNGILMCQFILATTLWHELGHNTEAPQKTPSSVKDNTKSWSSNVLSSPPLVGKGVFASTSTSVTQKTVKEQFLVRCTGTEPFVRTVASVLQNGMLLELEGDAVIHLEEVRKGLQKEHLEIRVTQSGLQSAQHLLRVLHCGPLQKASLIQEKIRAAYSQS